MLRTLSICLLLVANVEQTLAAQFLEPRTSVQQTYSLLAERLDLMQAVAAWKWTHALPVYDASREAAVLERTIQQASALGMDAGDTRRLFEIQIEWARILQQRYIDHWRKNGLAETVAIEDLNQSIRPKLDAIGHQLLQALYLGAQEFGSADTRGELAAQSAALVAKFGLTQEQADDLTAALASLHTHPVAALERIRAAGVLRIGVTGDYAPFSSDRGGTLHGADVELAQALAKTLGVQAVFVRTTWSSLIGDYESGTFDLAMGGITITPAREQVAFFSVPYHHGGKSAVVRCVDRARFNSFKKIDTAGVRVIVNPGGTNDQFVREHITRAQVQIHADNRTIFDEIIAGRADAMITDDVEVDLQTHHHAELCRAFSKPLTEAAKAIMLDRDPALRAEVNRWLQDQLKRGEVRHQIELAVQND